MRNYQQHRPTVKTTVKWILSLTLYHTIRLSTTLKNSPLENIVGKGENAGCQHLKLLTKILDTLKLQELAEDKMNVTQKWKFALERKEDIVNIQYMINHCLTLSQTSPGFYVSTVQFF